MVFATVLAIVASAFVPPAPDSAYMAADIGDIRTHLASNDWQRIHLRLEGCIAAAVDKHFVLRDSRGDRVLIENECQQPSHAGDLVRLDCDARIARSRNDIAIFAKRLRVIGHAKPDIPKDLSLATLTRENHQPVLVVTRGVITEVFQDEVDSKYAFLILESFGVKILIPFKLENDTVNVSGLDDWLDEAVSVSGVYTPGIGSRNRQLRHMIRIPSLQAIKRLSVQKRDPFEAAPLDPLADEIDHEALEFPHRNRVRGLVLAVRNDKTVFVRTDDGCVLRVLPCASECPPPPGATVTVSGFATTGLFFKYLVNARIRRETADPPAACPPAIVSATTVLFNEHNQPMINPRTDGSEIRLRGIVKDVVRTGSEDGLFVLETDGISVQVETGSHPAPRIGSTVEVSGICAITSEESNYNDQVTHLNGFAAITRTADDIRILAQPPWWTVGRLFAAVCVLFALLLVIFTWNRVLRKLVERRSRELLKEQIASVTAVLKADERARLSVELHDSFSQNLTGISFRIDAAAKSAKVRPELVAQHLDTAKRMLLSCREELRDCINDLRNDVYGEENVAEAIRKTVLRNIGDCALTVDCEVPRCRLSDSTLHTLLMIVRELSSNAVRHGRATAITVSVVLDERGLHVTVADNGCGFDPKSRPGMSDGHFGLQGIADRIALAEGTVNCESEPGKGARFTIFIPERKDS